MSTIQQADKQEAATISFRCDPEWKKEVGKAAIDRGETIQEICIAAVTRYLKISGPKQNAA